MSNFVFDTSALLVLIFNEPGVDVVRDALSSECFISTINIAEAASRLADRGFEDVEVQDALLAPNLYSVPLEPEVALAAGLMRRTTRSAGLSIGDRCCIALAQRLGLPAVTADRAWLTLDLGIRVELCR